MVFFDSVDQSFSAENRNILEHYTLVSLRVVSCVYRTRVKSQYVLHSLALKRVTKVALIPAAPSLKSPGISRGPLLVFCSEDNLDTNCSFTTVLNSHLRAGL